ncbi:MAG: hypothetical protein JSV88_21230 [Candidatus Aminicenantes bacterium]|nr:MAG: hypothetical protein JSV88_21230 [Candidatus Aminicenantes bacterium]
MKDFKFFKRLGGKILVMLVLVAFSPLTSMGSALTLDDIPRLPGSELKHSQYKGPENLHAEFWIFLPEGIKFQEISAKGTYFATTCVSMMKENGWTLKKENWQRRGGEFIFKKDVINEVKVNVSPSSKAIKGRMKPYIFLKFKLKRLIPFEDVIGMDPGDVPRYPGSIRVRWMNLLGDFGEKYLVVAPLTKVKAFFEKEIPKYGWKASKGSATLNYIKGGIQSPQELSAGDKELAKGKPLQLVKKMIPTTLSLRIQEKEGIVEIGVGRTAGSADKGKSENYRITPEKNIPPGTKKLLTFIDVEKDIPLYPGLQKTSERKAPVDFRGEEIITLDFEKKDAPMKEAIKMADYYLAEMKQKDWRLLDEEWHGIGRKLLFQKGAVKVRIHVKAVGRWPIPEKARKIKIPLEIVVTFPIPSREIAGEDIEGIPRFPGSVRFYTLKAGIDHIVKFKAVAPVKEVEWFFIEKLPEHGWTFSGNDTTGLLFIPAKTAGSAAEAFSKGQLIPTTLKIKVDDQYDGTVKIGMDKTKGDS